MLTARTSGLDERDYFTLVEMAQCAMEEEASLDDYWDDPRMESAEYCYGEWWYYDKFKAEFALATMCGTAADLGDLIMPWQYFNAPGGTGRRHPWEPEGVWEYRGREERRVFSTEDWEDEMPF